MDLVDYLVAHERGEVLNQLLKKYVDLRREADAIARDLLDDVSVDATSVEVTERVLGIGMEELGARTGSKPWGYVEVCDVVWELLEEAVEGVQNDMIRRMEAGMESAAEKLCQGIVLGLYEAEKEGSDDVIGHAPDFAMETAADTVSTLLKMFPPGSRRAAGRRFIQGVQQPCGDWLEMLQRVVKQFTPSGKGPRKHR